jgi:hypothetical protein
VLQPDLGGELDGLAVLGQVLLGQRDDETIDVIRHAVSLLECAALSHDARTRAKRELRGILQHA